MTPIDSITAEAYSDYTPDGNSFACVRLVDVERILLNHNVQAALDLMEMINDEKHFAFYVGDAFLFRPKDIAGVKVAHDGFTIEFNDLSRAITYIKERTKE